MLRALLSPPEGKCPACGHGGCLWNEAAPLAPPRWAGHRLLARLLRRVMDAPLRCRHCRTAFVHTEELPRVVVGYHGCRSDFARDLVAGRVSVARWQSSRNDYDWLGEGVYFWEHAPGRAWQWARERYGDDGAVVAAEIRLGRCLDLGDTRFTALLPQTYEDTVGLYERAGRALPKNAGRELKLRRLDRLIVDELVVTTAAPSGLPYQTVRCPFEEGGPVYPGAMIRAQSHVQVAVRDRSCIKPRIYLVNRPGG